jgi:hypothetical protein
MAEKQAPQKPSFKKPVKHAASEIEHRDISKSQMPLRQKLPGKSAVKDMVDVNKDKTESDEEKSILKDIIAITGQGGLFKYISQARNGIIVESLETGKRMQAFSSMKVNSLKDIAVYTKQEEIPLEEVLKKISEKESGGASIDHKSSPDELKSYFLKILPDFDQERVYISDIKKMINWYNILQKYNLLKFEEEVSAPAEASTEKKAGDKIEAKAKADKNKGASKPKSKLKSTPKSTPKSKSTPSSKAKPKT